MKRILSCILVVLLLLPCLSSCVKRRTPATSLPADFIMGEDVVIDNETRYVYIETGEEYSSDAYFYFEFGQDQTYQEFKKYFKNKIVRHYQTENSETYYTIYSLINHQLLYIFLKPTDDGSLELSGVWDILDSRTTIPNDMVFDYDQPSVILDGRMPDYCYKEHYSFDEITNKIEAKWTQYENLCAEADLKPYFSISYDFDEYVELYRIIHEVYSDVFKTVGGNKNSYSGLYNYDILIFKDGSGELRYKHYIYEKYPKYTLDQEVTVPLTPEEVTSFKAVLENNNFGNIPTWNPEERTGFHGEYTYIIGPDSQHFTHLIAMWQSTPRYGIYHIRTAAENLVRQKIEVTSGKVYVDYEQLS